YLSIVILLCIAMSFPLQAMPSIHDGLDALNHHEFAKAEKIFADQADKGDVHARYWQANAMFLQRGKKAFAAGQIMLQAAKKGDPWAMNRLDPSNNESPCGMFGWPCDSKWLDKALAIWKKQAKQGDGNAELALLLRDRPWYLTYIPVLSQKMYASRIADAFLNGSDYAALRIPGFSVKKKYEYIKQVANKGNCEAMFDYGVHFDDNSEDYLDWMKKSARCGYSKAALYALITDKLNGNYSEAYFYGVLGTYIGGSKTNIDPFYEPWIKNIIKDKRDQIKSEVKQYVEKNNIKPTKNYSEFSEEFFGIY
ncbi:hypothetical protein, partial [Celerinatantimonas sp. MCCC 1A17872]|uniref:hypothetical protein n=1 Tax=Celerinatantimonas sp. MCCC 1A17872 TaxID=3177514 RepID=UPI0038BF25E4